MGTSWSVRAVAAPTDVRREILSVLDGIIARMSNWEADSDLSRFNRAPIGEWQTLPADLLEVIQAGLYVARASGGAFDPAIGAIVQRWGFGPPGSVAPVPLLSGRPWQAIEIDGVRARRMADVALDLSGIAKGFAVDAVAERLNALGLRHYLVEIGGELRGAGVKPDGQPFWVDLETPPGLSVPTMRVALCGLSVATSGDYRRYRDEGDRRLSHTIDPATGAPIDNRVASVSVLHESAMLADAWATAIGVLGPREGMQLAARQGLAALMIVREESGAIEHMTPALTEMLD